MNGNVIIPIAVAFELDDVGWHNGRDLRLNGQASRSGLPRNHAPEDYEVLDLIGRAVGSKITVGIPLADWDKDNLLRGEVGITHDPYGWNRASEIDMEYAKRCFDLLEGSEYIEYACHGLMHGVYSASGERINEHDFITRTQNADGSSTVRPVEDLKRRLDLYFQIYDSWGFKKPCETFIVGGGVGGICEDTLYEMTAVLREYGFKYWTNGGYPFEGPIGVYNGITCLNQTGKQGRDYAPWNAYDVDPSVYGDFIRLNHPKNSNVFGMHWTNMLRFNPKKNCEAVPLWTEYFNRQSEVFGSMNARDLEFSVNQQFYNSYVTLTENKGVVTVDLSAVRKNAVDWLKNEFYLSVKNGFSPRNVEGASIELYESKASFNTYRISTNEKTVKFSI